MNLKIIVLLCVFLHSLHSQTLVFRLDDVQCWWKEETSLNIIQLFLNYKIPLSIGIITSSGVDCFAERLREMYYNGDSLLDVTSHSVTHGQMMHMSLDQQIAEACESKHAIESFLGPNTVRMFFFSPI